MPLPSTTDSPASTISYSTTATAVAATDQRPPGAALRDRSATRILAQSLVCDLLEAGLDTHDLIAVAAEFVDQVTRRSIADRREVNLEHGHSREGVADDRVAPPSEDESRAASEYTIEHGEVHTPHPTSSESIGKRRAG